MDVNARISMCILLKMLMVIEELKTRGEVEKIEEKEKKRRRRCEKKKKRVKKK